MNKKLIAASALAVLLIVPLASSAITFTNQPAESNINLVYVIQGILTAVWWVFMGIVVILFMIAGLQFLTAQGDPSKLEQARQFVIWGFAGVTVGVLSFSIIAIVKSTFVI